MNETQRLINAAFIREPLDTIASLPEWFEQFRPSQAEAVNDIIDAYRRGVRLVVLDAPTGAGKTLIAETVRRIIGGKASYVCNTKTLQQQFVEDFPYAKLLQGRSNYPTWDDELPVTADDCNETKTQKCSWCPSKPECPYEMAKQAAWQSPLAVLNTAYFLGETNGPGTFKHRDLVVMDEADTLENIVMRYVGLQISRRRIEQLKLGEPTKVTKEEAWKDWVTEAIPLVEGQVPVLHDNDQDIQRVREWKFLSGLAGKLKGLRGALDQGGWVYTGKNGAVEFKPVLVDTVSPLVVWPNARRFLLMSATIISAEAELAWHGWNEPYEVVSMGSSFPVESRRVKIVAAADMSKKANEVDKMLAALQKVMDRHPGERILCHTVSYDLARQVTDYVKSTGRKAISYTEAGKRDLALNQFKRSKGGVLVASSMDRGVDLPDDLCRVVVVCKVPFPYLGDRQISSRLYAPGGQQWYNIQTIRTLVQMCGRATRHKDDWSVTYVLDSQFGRVWGSGRRLFPQWFVDALEWRDRLLAITTPHT